MIKKDTIKIFIIIAIVLGVIIYSLISFKKDTEEISYDNIITVSTNDTNKSEINKIKVYVTGAVNIPGVVELEENSRIEDAIKAAGGITSEAILDNVNLAYALEDGQKLIIPDSTDIKEYLTIESGIGIINEEKKTDKVNINTNNIEELMKLPGVGENLAQKIIDYKNQNGKFKNIEDLKNVSGIGEKKYEILKEYLTLK